jgi:hypothetical protein
MCGNRKKRKFTVTDLHLCAMVFYVKVVLGCLEFSVQSQRCVCSDMYVPICLYFLLSRGNQTPVDITSLSELKPLLHHRRASIWHAVLCGDGFDPMVFKVIVVISFS